MDEVKETYSIGLEVICKSIELCKYDNARAMLEDIIKHHSMTHPTS